MTDDEERSAIHEFEAGFSREESELLTRKMKEIEAMYTDANKIAEEFYSALKTIYDSRPAPDERKRAP